MAGYSKRPLEKKLGIKEGFEVLLVNEPFYYYSLFEKVPDITEAKPDQSEVDFIHLFAMSIEDLEKHLLQLKQQLSKTGILWISWPKKSAKLKSDLDGNIVRQAGLDCGLVDVKVCAVDEIWSGLKFMYRIKDR